MRRPPLDGAPGQALPRRTIRLPRWSTGRTVLTGALAGLGVDGVLVLLVPARAGRWWLGAALGLAVGGVLGWYGAQRRPPEEP